MIQQNLAFDLPLPWAETRFETQYLGPINFLVGPNGSGKSRFAVALKSRLPGARLLSTDRLRGMNANEGLGFLGEHFGDGYAKGLFAHFKNAAATFGAGLDTFVILEERPDIRIHVEATLSHLFNRNVYLEWDSGNLVPKALLGGTGQSYRIDRDECHGIKELMVLLTNLYNDQNPYLIIDEPELNLHPQFQAFFMQEARRVAGKPEAGTWKKIVFLVTHSPFLVDIRTEDDLRSTWIFDSTFSRPRSLASYDQAGISRLVGLIPRLNVHHKQLFFSDNPTFVEGILDAQLIASIQEQRSASMTAAGSCLIDAGGCEEVNRYLELCKALGKDAYFLYDLDSLFTGSLRQCIKSDTELSAFLAALGLGCDFAKYCGELDRRLFDGIQKIVQCDEPEVSDLKEHLKALSANGGFTDKRLQKARVAILVKLARQRSAMVKAIGESAVADIQGRLDQIVSSLKEVNVILLPGGAIEHYLPSFAGDIYDLNGEAKKSAVESEITLLAKGAAGDLKSRYGDLFAGIACLPAKPPVDTEATLTKYLADFVHDLQGLVLTHKEWTAAELNRHFSTLSSGIGRLFKLSEFKRVGEKEFKATISVAGPGGKKLVHVSHETNAGMRKFVLENADAAKA